MYRVISICMFMALAVAAPTEDAQAKILSYENENDGLGNYEFSFETSNGISRSETGKLVNVGEPNEHIEVQGSYTYTDPEGKLIVVNYYADENGYHQYGVADQEGSILPVVPVVVQALPAALTATLLG